MCTPSSGGTGHVEDLETVMASWRRNSDGTWVRCVQLRMVLRDGRMSVLSQCLVIHSSLMLVICVCKQVAVVSESANMLFAVLAFTAAMSTSRRLDIFSLLCDPDPTQTAPQPPSQDSTPPQSNQHYYSTPTYYQPQPAYASPTSPTPLQALVHAAAFERSRLTATSPTISAPSFPPTASPTHPPRIITDNTLHPLSLHAQIHTHPHRPWELDSSPRPPPFVQQPRQVYDPTSPAAVRSSGRKSDPGRLTSPVQSPIDHELQQRRPYSRSPTRFILAPNPLEPVPDPPSFEVARRTSSTSPRRPGSGYERRHLAVTEHVSTPDRERISVASLSANSFDARGRDPHRPSGRRSPPGSQIGRAKAARKLEEAEALVNTQPIHTLKTFTQPHLPRHPVSSPVPYPTSPIHTHRPNDKSPTIPHNQHNPIVSISPPTPLVAVPFQHTSGQSQILSPYTQAQSTPTIRLTQRPASRSTHHPKEQPHRPRDGEDPHSWFLQQFDPPLNVIRRASPPTSPSTIIQLPASKRTTPSATAPDAATALEEELDDIRVPLEKERMVDIPVDPVDKLVAETLEDEMMNEAPMEVDVDKELLSLVESGPSQPKDQKPSHKHSPQTSDPALTQFDPATDSFEANESSELNGGWLMASNQGVGSKKKKESNSKVSYSYPKSIVVHPFAVLQTASKKKAPPKMKATRAPLKAKTKPNESTIVPPPRIAKSTSSSSALKKSAQATSRSRSASVKPAGWEHMPPIERNDRVPEPDSSEDDKLYCVCKTKYDEDRFMIACDRYGNCNVAVFVDNFSTGVTSGTIHSA